MLSWLDRGSPVWFCSSPVPFSIFTSPLLLLPSTRSQHLLSMVPCRGLSAAECGWAAAPEHVLHVVTVLFLYRPPLPLKYLDFQSLLKSTIRWVNPFKSPADLHRLKGCFLTAGLRHAWKASLWRWDFPACSGRGTEPPALAAAEHHPGWADPGQLTPAAPLPGGATALPGWSQQQQVKPEGFVNFFCFTLLSLSALRQLIMTASITLIHTGKQRRADWQQNCTDF